MKRKQWDRLIRWKASANRKPLIVRGARHTGKTWLIKEFGRTEYRQYIYLNFRTTPRLRRLTFPEFLQALDEPFLGGVLNKFDWPIMKNFRSTYVELLKQYYYVGGMPEAVSSFSEQRDFKRVRRIQKEILTSYDESFPKTVPDRIRPVWDSVLTQLAKKNRKFTYDVIKKGARAKDYAMALSWLINSGFVCKVNDVSSPGLPLRRHEHMRALHHPGAFKLFLLDVGLLAAMGDVDAKRLAEDHVLFAEFNGALTEQYVLQQLIAQKQSEMPVDYWHPKNV